MLDDKDLAKLCHGRIVYAEVYDSSGSGPAGPHYGIILNTDEQIKAFKRNPIYQIVVISHNDAIDPHFIIDVPARTGLDGKIVGSWVTQVHEAGIQKIHQKLIAPEMIKVQELVRAADQAKQAAKRPPQP
jgi:hypothetical protein